MVRILIADDSPQVRQGLRSLLEKHGNWEICGEAENGKEALEKTQQLSPDVLVLDYFMPVIDGMKVARQLAKTSPRVSILLCSMYLDAQLARLARSAGVLGVVSKSNTGQIVNGIEAILRGELFIASRI